MFGLLYRKGGRLYFREFVQQLEERIFGVRDEVDRAVGDAAGVSCWEGAEVLEADQERVAVVGGEVIRRQKICAEDSVFDVCNSEFEGKVGFLISLFVFELLMFSWRVTMFLDTYWLCA